MACTCNRMMVDAHCRVMKGACAVMVGNGRHMP